MNNRDKLCRTPDGRYRVGAFIARDAHGRFVAEVLVALKGVDQEVLPVSAQRLPPEAAFEDAAREAREWAFQHLPRIYEFDPQDLEVELLHGAAVFT